MMILIKLYKLKTEQKAFPDPLFQINRQETMLREWMDSHQLPILPIHGLVVMSNVLSIIRSNHEQYTQKIIRCSTTLSQKIIELEEYYQDNNEIQVKELRKIFKRIMKGHCPLNQFILDLYGISKEEMIKGIFCERCNKCPLKRIHGRWKCDYCSWTSKDAHKRALVIFIYYMEKK